MKLYLIIIIIVLLCQNVNSNGDNDKIDEKKKKQPYTFAHIGRDFVSSVKNAYAFVKDNLTNLPGAVSDLIDLIKKKFTRDKKKKKETMVQFDELELDAEARRAFSEFAKNNWDGGARGELDNPALVNLKSESTVQLATPQLALWHGRNLESHVVETKDGYFLTVHRLQVNRFVRNRTVFLHHGLLGSSTDWILSGPQKSLPYILADAGYDVWIANARGNYYSRGHSSRTVDFPDYPNYWTFSWQEMGQYDLPAVIDYIRLVKNTNESINFVGHSMGATALLVLLSTAPRYNEYLRMGILLAPLAFMGNVKGPIKMLTTVSETVIKTMGDGEFLPSRKVPSWLANKYCSGPKSLCSNPLLFLSGIPQHKNWNASFIAQLLYHVPAGGSINTILHYVQLAKSGKFHKYDDENFEFPVNEISLPIALFSSSDDWIATVPDVLKLYFLIQKPIDHHIIRNRNVSHTDFVWGTEASALVFNKIVEYLEDGLNWNMLKVNEILR